MELINQHTKRIMEGCKERAREAGLRFEDETLEYIVTNRDLLEMTPKLMIPTLYDYWVHDVEVLREKGKYELYPGNPYETVINTRPAISFYNDNNPDWLNVMIFYHVLAHIDFFQNNIFYRHTWDYDFTGQALSDKRLISAMRAEKGRWVDYVIEFARSIDNMVGYYTELAGFDRSVPHQRKGQLDYYFDVFLQDVKKVKISEYIKEVDRYNECRRTYGPRGEKTFFADAVIKYPELDALYKRYLDAKSAYRPDLIQYIMENSEFLKKEENKWMKSVIEVVRNTSMFFQPQIRTKIMNEGWASYWHEVLFMNDERIAGHEVDFAKVHAGVTAMPRVGLNPYALGLRLYYFVREMADKGRYSFDFERILDSGQRKKFDAGSGAGRDFLFHVRKNFSDFMFINTFVDQDFVNQYKLFVSDRRLNQSKMVWEYYVKSRNAKDYKNMLVEKLYHPPHIVVDLEKSQGSTLYLQHHFEGKPLVREYISNTMLGVEYLWGGPVQLETSELEPAEAGEHDDADFLAGVAAGGQKEAKTPELKWLRVLYTMSGRKLSRKPLVME